MDASDLEGFVHHMPETRNGWPVHPETESPTGIDANDPFYKFLGLDELDFGFAKSEDNDSDNGLVGVKEEYEHDGSQEEVDDDDDDRSSESLHLMSYKKGGRYFSYARRLESDSGSDVPDDEPVGAEVYPDPEPEPEDLDGEPCI